MTDTVQTIKDKIILNALTTIGQDGWSWHGIESAAKAAGYKDGMEYAVFPGGLSDAVAHFSDFIDRAMISALNKTQTDQIRIRERIHLAVITRFELLKAMKAQAAVKATLSYWALPTRVMMGQQILWRTADHIWAWAGDTSKDYNHYTKRGLLNSILIGTSLVFVDDESENLEVTRAFLQRRIDNIMEIGKAIGGAKTMASSIIERYKTARR